MEMTAQHLYCLSLVIVMVTVPLCHAQKTSTPYTTEEKNEFAILHNRVREATGPTLANMKFVIWSDTLAGIAQTDSDLCIKKHTANMENIDQAHFDPKRSPESTVLEFYAEKANYNLDKGVCAKGNCGHFAMMMGQGISEFGCGRTLCPPMLGIPTNTYIVFCRYNVNNGPDLAPFYGPSCTRCPADAPWCLHGLCVNKTVANSSSAKLYDPSASASMLTCKLECKNCEKRVTTGGECKCEKSTSTDKCPQCADSPCLNGGEEDTSVTTECKCKCKDGAVGARCEITKTVFDNSVALTIGAENEYSAYDTKIKMPVPKSVFTSKIWPTLKPELTSAVNSFCSAEANFAKCCPGKTFPGASAATSKHITDADLKISDTSFTNNADGSLRFLLHAVPSGSALCSAGASGRKRRDATETYVPQSVMLSAIQASKDAISAKLKAIPEFTSEYQKVILQKVEQSNPPKAPPSSSGPLLKAGGILVTISCILVLALVEFMRGGHF